MIAKSFFNDTYKLFSVSKDDNGNEIKNKININETDIANDYDKKYMFKNHPDYKNIQWIDVTNGKNLFLSI